MIENKQNSIESTRKSPEPEFNLREIISKYIRYWYWFVILTAISLFLAKLYLRYATPIYEVKSEIIIKDDKGSGLSQQNILKDLDIFNTKSNVDDEIEVLKTRYLMQKVVEELQLNVSYFASGNIKTTEIYKDAPFYVTLLSLKDSIPIQQFPLQLSASNTGFFITTDSVKIQHRFEDTLETHNLKMIVHRRYNIPVTIFDYLISINSPDRATDLYLNNISIMLANKQSNVIEMTMNTTIPAKGEAILTKLYEVYTRINREDKNKIADSTIHFINDRLGKVTEELTDVEKNVERFKKENNLSTDVNQQSVLLLNNISDLEKQIIQQEVQINVLESIEKHLKSSAFRVVPSALVIQDPTYFAMVEKYNALVLERDNQLQTSKEDNPLILGLNQQVLNVKRDLLTSVSNIKQGMVIARNDLSLKNNQLLRQVNTAPSKERAFMEIARQQEVKQQLYLYLLQKREETAISKSGQLANSRLIEPAKSSHVPFRPNSKIIYLIAGVLGLLIPAGLIIVKDLLNNKILSKKDVTKITSVPVFGELGHNNTGETIIAKQDARTTLAEQFRLMRTNLQFILKGKENQIIMLTSSMSGEGKSFLSTNLASSLAISGKKVVLMELDLRKPKISKALGLTTNSGFTNYIVSDITINSLLQQVPQNPNLYVISAGIIPPNPAELLLQPKVAELFNSLRKTFDFIIVDTAPVGLVTDALLISKFADANIYVVRQNFTLKEHIEIINDLHTNAKMDNMSILINDVSNRGTYGYGYGGSGYYTDQPEKIPFLTQVKKKLGFKV